MLRIAILAGVLFLGTASQAFSQRIIHNGSNHQVVTLQLQNYAVQMHKLSLMGVDIAGVDIARRIVDVHVSPKELEAIKQYLPNARIHIPRNELTNMRRKPDEEYYTLAKVEAKLKQLQAKAPQIMATRVIGKSLRGRPIYAVKISDNVGKREIEEPTILFNSMHHSREVMTTEVAMDTIETLVGFYGRSKRVRSYVDSNEIWVVPMLNVDGNHIVWNKDNMWRKNGRENYGVDLNRNYPYNWNTCNGSSGSKWSQTYRGESAASEPETQALMKLVAAIRPVFDISYHSYSELVIYPLGCRGQQPPAGSMVQEVGRALAKTLPTDNRRGFYAPGTAWELLYSVDGGDIDWMWGVYNVLPYVIELNSRREGFQPKYKRWRDVTVKKARAGWGYLLERLNGSGLRGIVKTHRRNKAEVMVAVKSLDHPNWKPQVRRINPDSTFHFVLAPGAYQVTLSDGKITKPPVTVNIGPKRSDMTFSF